VYNNGGGNDAAIFLSNEHVLAAALSLNFFT
jgi:hypothetical protein